MASQMKDSRMDDRYFRQTRGRLITPHRQVKDTGWIDLDYEPASLYFADIFS